jgi:hypothetical protein
MNSRPAGIGYFGCACCLLGACTVQPVTYSPGPPPPPIYTGGYYGAHTTIVYDRYDRPPPLIVEKRPPPPAFANVWVPGEWHWNGRQWVWYRGHYRHA